MLVLIDGVYGFGFGSRTMRTVFRLACTDGGGRGAENGSRIEVVLSHCQVRCRQRSMGFWGAVTL